MKHKYGLKGGVGSWYGWGLALMTSLTLPILLDRQYVFFPNFRTNPQWWTLALTIFVFSLGSSRILEKPAGRFTAPAVAWHLLVIAYLIAVFVGYAFHLD